MVVLVEQVRYLTEAWLALVAPMVLPELFAFSVVLLETCSAPFREPERWDPIVFIKEFFFILFSGSFRQSKAQQRRGKNDITH